MGRSIAVFILLTLAACKKDKPAEPATGSAETIGNNSAEPVAKAPPPPGAVSSKLGEKTGDDFAKVDLSKRATTLSDKIELKDLEPVADNKQIQLMSAAAFSANKDEAAAAPTESPGFKVTYNPSRNAAHEEFRKIFQSNRVFEEVAEGLNKTIRIPTAVDINTVDCNTINAFYDPNTKRIIVCYELVSYFLGVFKPTAKNDTELGNAVLGALIFTFFHESGHGLIHLLDLAAVGREEDAVDQLATLILIAAGDEGVQMALSGAYWFGLNSKAGQNKLPFWDEHAFDGQRFYNILCLIYGSNPTKYGSFVSSGSLPKDRAVRCPEEYSKINKAWEKLLQPHLTNGAALNVNYKPHVPVKEAPKTTNEDPWGGDDDDGPTPPPVDPTPEGPKHAITCEQVARKAGELIAEEAKARAEKMSEDEVEALKNRLEHELPAVMEQLLAQCAKEDWSEASRKCLMDSKTLEQATKCQ